MNTVDFKLLGIKEGELILDAGCGIGRHSWNLIKGNYRVVSIDLDLEALTENYGFMKYMDTLGETRGTFCVIMRCLSWYECLNQAAPSVSQSLPGLPKSFIGN